MAGIVWPGACLYAAIFAAFPDLRGSASALFSAMRMLIMATAIFISGNLYQDTFRSVAGWMLVLIGCGFLLILGSRARPGAEITPDGLGPH